MLLIRFIFIFINVNLILSELTESEIQEQLYKKLFKRQRVEQLEAIKNFKKITNYEKQYSMILLMAEKIFVGIQESRAIIESSAYIPGVSDFPLDDKIKISLSNILENTALFSEIILRFPDICETILKLNNNWDILLQWSIAFSNQVRYLLDDSTIKVLSLVSQELNHIPRNPNYVNPYRRRGQQSNNDISTSEDGVKKKKRKVIKKGPRLSNYDEL